MKTPLIFIGLIAIALFLKSCSPSTDKESIKTNTTNSTGALTPIPKVNNDKIVVIKGANYNDIQKAVIQFCTVYNQEEIAAIPNLTRISDNEFAVTFPQDITFNRFCFFVNYMYYPENIFYKADIKAWATTKPDDDWITEKSANKKIMLFIPSDDKEYDNVYLTTQDNIGYKLGFAAGEESQLLETPKTKFIEQTLTIDSIKGKPTEEIK